MKIKNELYIDVTPVFARIYMDAFILHFGAA